LVAPATVNRTVTMPRRKPNSVYRTREHLTGAEVDRLIDAAKANRWGHRDATMILVAFRHGLRSSELVDLRWDQIDFTHAVLHVRRAKKGTPATHPVVGDEMRALRKLQREQDPKSPFVFTSERGSPFTTAGFARMVERAGVEAKLGFPAHPHMLRHAQQGPRHPGRCRLTSATATSSTRCDVRSDLYDQLQCHVPVIFEKRIVALKLLQCSVRKTNTESGFVRGGPKSNSIIACWLGGGVRSHVE